MALCGQHASLWILLVSVLGGLLLSVGLIRAFGLWGLLACLVLLAGGGFLLQALITRNGC